VKFNVGGNLKNKINPLFFVNWLTSLSEFAILDSMLVEYAADARIKLQANLCMCLKKK
jgi:hypothetical protein